MPLSKGDLHQGMQTAWKQKDQILPSGPKKECNLVNTLTLAYETHFQTSALQNCTSMLFQITKFGVICYSNDRRLCISHFPKEKRSQVVKLIFGNLSGPPSTFPSQIFVFFLFLLPSLLCSSPCFSFNKCGATMCPHPPGSPVVLHVSRQPWSSLAMYLFFGFLFISCSKNAQYTTVYSIYIKKQV